MKRCPKCNRVETDEALAFCRSDGTALVSDSGPVDAKLGTTDLGSGSVSSEIETSILPHTSTAPSINRTSGPTTVLPEQQIPGNTRNLRKPKSRRSLTATGIAVALTIPIAVVISVAGYFYFARTPSTVIESIVVLPFENRSGSPDTKKLIWAEQYESSSIPRTPWLMSALLLATICQPGAWMKRSRKQSLRLNSNH